MGWILLLCSTDTGLCFRSKFRREGEAQLLAAEDADRLIISTAIEESYQHEASLDAIFNAK